MTGVLHARTKRAIEAYQNQPAHAVHITGLPGIGKGFVAAHVASMIGGTTLFYDAATDTMGVEEIRELVRQARYKATMARTVIVIEHADNLGTEAQNTLLKVIEEPPNGTYFILTSSDQNSLLPTIRSRCQTITIVPPQTEQLQRYYESIGHERSAVKSALIRAAGLPGLSAALLHGEEHSFQKNLELAKNYLSATAIDRLRVVQELAKDRTLAVEFAAALLHTCQLALEHAATQQKEQALQRWAQQATVARRLEIGLANNAHVKLCLLETVVNI